MKKRILSIFLAILMIAALLPTAVFADGNPTVTLKTAAHGLLVASTDEDGQAVAGDPVLLIPIPDEGYRLKSIEVRSGSTVLKYGTLMGCCFFTMAEADVTVTPVFESNSAAGARIFSAATENKLAVMAKLFDIPQETIRSSVLTWLEDESQDTFENWDPFGTTSADVEQMEAMKIVMMIPPMIEKYAEEEEMTKEEKDALMSRFADPSQQALLFFPMILDSCFATTTEDQLKCFMDNVEILMPEIINAVEAIRDKDYLKITSIVSKLYDEMTTIMEEVYPDSFDLAPVNAVAPQNAYTALRARLKAEIAAVAAGGEEPLTGDEAIKDVLTAKLTAALTALNYEGDFEKFTKHVDTWMNDPNADTPLGMREAISELPATSAQFPQIFTELFCSAAAEFRAFFVGDCEDGSFIDHLRCLIDNALPLKEDAFQLIDAFVADEATEELVYTQKIYVALSEIWAKAFDGTQNAAEAFSGAYQEMRSGASVCLAENEAEPEDGAVLKLRLRGKEYGSFRFTEDEDGWLIEAYRPFDESAGSDKLWLAVSNGELTFTTKKKASVWTYADGALCVNEATQTQTPGFWFLFWYVPARTITRTTTYYLSSLEKGAALSTRFTPVTLYIETYNPSHDYDTEHPEPLYDGTHLLTCKSCGATCVRECVYDQDDGTACKCGAYDPEDCGLDVKCTPGKKTVYGWFWTRYTVFTMEIGVTGEAGESVTEIEYSLDGETWHRGTTITSNTEIIFFKVRVTDEHGIHIFSFPNSISTDSIR